MWLPRWLDCSTAAEDPALAVDCQRCAPGDPNGEEFRPGRPCFGPTPGCQDEEEVLGSLPRAAFAGVLPRGPAQRGVQTFEAAEVEVLHGECLHQGIVTQLILGESMTEMHLALYVNGFRLAPVQALRKGAPKPVTRSWSPFSLVDRCDVAGVFKLLVFRGEGPDCCYYFRAMSSNAEQECFVWVEKIVAAIADVTWSLFPHHAIDVQPLKNIASTSMRIMAGYLLKAGPKDSLLLCFCELQAYGEQQDAKLLLYVDESCEQEVQSIRLTCNMTICGRPGVFSSVFGVDRHRFCARSEQEKELWIRALSNMKVKLLFQAPDPTDEELAIFREAVQERVEALPPNLLRTPRTPRAQEGGAGDDLGSRSTPGSTPLLSKVPRASPRAPRGDKTDPDPVDEAADSVLGVCESPSPASPASPAYLAGTCVDGDVSGPIVVSLDAQEPTTPEPTDTWSPKWIGLDGEKHVVVSLDIGSPALKGSPAAGLASLDLDAPPASLASAASAASAASPDGSPRAGPGKMALRWL